MSERGFCVVINIKYFMNAVMRKYIKKEGSMDSENSTFSEILHHFVSKSGFDQEFCESLILEFCKQSERIIAEIKENIGKKDFTACSKLLHLLKGSSGSIFATDIARSALEGEEAAGRADTDSLISIVRKMEGLLGSLYSGCKKDV